MTTIVCFGDSNTHGFDPATRERFDAPSRWPGVLRSSLGPGHEVIEEGLNGRTTIWDDPFEPGRNGRAYLLPCLQSHAPVDLVVIMLGTNDLKSIYRLTAADIASGARSLVELTLGSQCGPDHGAPGVLLVAPPPLGTVTAASSLWGLGSSAVESRELAAFYRTAAAQAGCDMLDAGELISVSPLDGVHLDREGAAVLGRAVAEWVRGKLG